MRIDTRSLWFLILGLPFLMLHGRGWIPAAPLDDPPPPWFSDFAAARTEAEKSDRPLLVVFRCTH